MHFANSCNSLWRSITVFLFPLLICSNLANSLPTNVRREGNGQQQQQIIIQNRPNAPNILDIPLLIQIQLMPVPAQGKSSSQNAEGNGKNLPFVDGHFPSPKLLLQTGPMLISSNKNMNAKEMDNQNGALNESSEEKVPSETEYDWAPNTSAILGIICLLFMVYFFGSIWFFCYFLAPVRSTFLSSSFALNNGFAPKPKSQITTIIPPLHA